MIAWERIIMHTLTLYVCILCTTHKKECHFIDFESRKTDSVSFLFKSLNVFLVHWCFLQDIIAIGDDEKNHFCFLKYLVKVIVGQEVLFVVYKNDVLVACLNYFLFFQVSNRGAENIAEESFNVLKFKYQKCMLLRFIPLI